MKRTILCGFAFLFTGCASPMLEDSQQRSDELVSSQTFADAARVVQSINYLPFAYKQDGCYARSLYMAMELAYTGHESNAIFAFAKPGTVLRVGKVEWGYHVAPMLFVGDAYQSARWMVIDPSISSTALDAVDWIGRMGFGASTPGSQYPSVATVPGAALGPADPDFDARTASRSGTPITDVPNFASMPAFKVSKIQFSCNTMHSYLALENAPDVATKSATLVSRTSQLIVKLNSLRKISADATFNATECAGSK